MILRWIVLTLSLLYELDPIERIMTTWRNVLLAALAISDVEAFSHPSNHLGFSRLKTEASGHPKLSCRCEMRFRMINNPSPATDKQDTEDVTLDMNELESLRQEIEDLKAEALLRVNKLANRVDNIEVMDNNGRQSQENDSRSSEVEPLDSVKRSATLPKSQVVPLQIADDKFPTSPKKQVEIPRKVSSNRRDNDLLVGTDWRILFSVGREPGTWMPKTWGVSGERLFVSLEVVFSDEQLYEREDFLGSIGDARVLKVLNDEIILGPSVREGSRTYKVKGGGWRIVKGQGPMGTDLLRFYIECDTEIRHKGGDVYVPAGRIYATCGYFPMNHPRSWEKANLGRKLEEIQERGERKQEAMRNEGMFSLKRLSLYRELVQLKIDAEKISSQLYDARVRDPDMSLLRKL